MSRSRFDCVAYHHNYFVEIMYLELEPNSVCSTSPSPDMSLTSLQTFSLYSHFTRFVYLFVTYIFTFYYHDTGSGKEASAKSICVSTAKVVSVMPSRSSNTQMKFRHIRSRESVGLQSRSTT